MLDLCAGGGQLGVELLGLGGGADRVSFGGLGPLALLLAEMPRR